MLVSERQLYANEGIIPGQPVPGSASAAVHQVIGSMQLDYKISSNWVATLVGQISNQQTPFQIAEPQANHVQKDDPNRYALYSVEPRIDGKVFDAWGGAAQLAVGGEFRREDYNAVVNMGTVADPSAVSAIAVGASRHISSAYGELLIPFIGKDNAVPLAQQLQNRISPVVTMTTAILGRRRIQKSVSNGFP